MAARMSMLQRINLIRIRMAILVLLVGLLPLVMRTLLVSSQASMDLASDAEDYHGNAVELIRQGGFPEGTYKGPLHILVLSVLFSIFGSSTIIQRSMSLVLSLLTLLVSFLAVRKWFGRDAALLTVFLLASNVYAVFNSFGGLREELTSFIVISLLYVFLDTKVPVQKSRLFLISFLMALLYFSRSLDGMLVAFTLLAYFLIWPIVRRRRVSIAPIICLLLGFAPSLLVWHSYQAAALGNPFAEINEYATWGYWLEIKGGAGPKPQGITLTEYLFNYHSIWQLLTASMKGGLDVVRMIDLVESHARLPIIGILILSSTVLMLDKINLFYLPILTAVVFMELGLLHALRNVGVDRLLIIYMPIIFALTSMPLTKINDNIQRLLKQPNLRIRFIFDTILVLLLVTYAYKHYSLLRGALNLAWDATSSLIISAVVLLGTTWIVLDLATRKNIHSTHL